MKRTTVIVALVLVVSMVFFATTAFAGPMPAYSFLSIDQGVGSADNTPCTVGSCFVLRNGPYAMWIDIGPGLDGGIFTEYDQLPGGQEDGPSWYEISAGQISDAWNFFSAYGTFATAPFSGAGGPPNWALTEVTTDFTYNTFDYSSCADAAACAGKTVLGTWHMAWNGNAVPMGSALGCQSTNTAACRGVTKWTVSPSPATTTSNSTYELQYTWAVPDGDPSGFGNVMYQLVLRGSIAPSDDPPANLCANVTCAGATDCKLAAECNTATGLCDPAQNKLNGTSCFASVGNGLWSRLS